MSGARNKKIIIIGAGAAGVAAASKLLDNGFTNVVVLEAKDRIGGRIHTVKFGENLVDLGAEYCLGENSNVVYELVKDSNLLAPEPSDPKYVYPKGRTIDAKLQASLIDIYHKIYYNENRSTSSSLEEHINQRFLECIDEFDKEEKQIALEVFEVIRKQIMRYEGSFSLDNVAGSSDYVWCEGTFSWNWNGHGYKTILDLLTKNVPNELFYLHKDVVSVCWDENTSITCADGTEYQADHVILTVPLGVLKREHRTLFRPLLPLSKQVAIERLQMQATAKIFLHFPSKWWTSTDFSGALFVWTEDTLKEASKLKHLQINGKSWVHSMIGLYPVSQNPNVLRVWFVGEMIPEIEKCAEENIVNGVMYVLRLFLGKQYPNISNPDKIARCNWYSDQHFRGTYSFQGLETHKGEHSDAFELSLPLLSGSGKPTLLFAGEATHPKYYSTVHGAIETGFREADRLISLYL